MVPTFTSRPFDQVGAQLYPGSIATVTPQTFTVASCPTTTTGPRVDHSSRRKKWAATRYKTGPYPPDLSRHTALRDFNHWFTRVAPSDLARRTRIVWSCRHVPPLSGLLPTLAGVPRIRLPPASTDRCDGLLAESFHLHMVKWRFVAHVVRGVLAGRRRSGVVR
jgi:hypothetical protein